MIIALDFDNTYTLNPKMWDKVLETFVEYATIYIVTSRSPDIPIDYLPKYCADVVYCSFKPKLDVMEELGIPVNIWIDDDPLYIIKPHFIQDSTQAVNQSIEPDLTVLDANDYVDVYDTIDGPDQKGVTIE